MAKRIVGKQATFNYPAEFTTLADYTAQAGRPVIIKRRLRKDEYDFEGDQMFEVVAADGWVGHAFISELTFDDCGGSAPQINHT